MTHELNQEWRHSFPVWLELHNNIHVFVNSINSLQTLEEDTQKSPSMCLVLKVKGDIKGVLSHILKYFCSFSNRL